jgi:hypothetical protein
VRLPQRGVAQPRYLISVWYETNCDSQEDFKQLADAFGESPQCTPDQLFSCLTAFMDAYEVRSPLPPLHRHRPPHQCVLTRSPLPIRIYRSTTSARRRT